MKQQNKEKMSYISEDILDRKWIDVNIPCKSACPIMTDIPGYIQAILEGDYEKAYRINRVDNVLPGVLGRVCHRPCEDVCRHGWDGLGDPVSICFLKRSSSDFGHVQIKAETRPAKKHVCIIGAGPAGLTAGNDLALKGYQVTILEQFEESGGMLRYGIPQFRLPHEIVERDVRSITDLGVYIKNNVRTEELDIAKLIGEYDAVIVAGGCMTPKQIDIPGLKSQGVFGGLDFMMAANREETKPRLKRVVVIGGGFTAVDCTRMALRLGADEVTLAYRRVQEDMYVSSHELVAMEAEGIKFSYLVSPVGIEVSDGVTVGVKLVRNTVDNDGKLDAIQGSEFIMEADAVIFAIGQSAEEILGRTDAGHPEKNLYQAGDFRNGASTVIEAAADGRKIAKEVHKKLSNIRGYQELVEIEKVERTGRERDFDFISRQPMDEIPINERREKNREVDLGFSREKSLIEAKRCYLCHYNFQIDIDRCIYCLACIDVMPVNCIQMAKDIIILDDGNVNYVETSRWDAVEAITIDNDNCIRCGNCYRACPVDCISISKYSLSEKELK